MAFTTTHRHHHEEPPNPSKKCKFLASALKDAFSNCHTFRARLSGSTRPLEDDHSLDDFDNEQDEIFVSAVIRKYMESKCKRRTALAMDGFWWDFTSASGEKGTQRKGEDDEEEKEEFLSVGSRLSRSSSLTSMDAFYSAKTNFSRCSSLNGIDFQGLRRRSIILEFRHCQGWPFGLCRKVLLLPPLPKSPADSWCWRKSASARLSKIP